MTESYSIDGTPTNLVRDDTPELVESADHGNVGAGSLKLDDVAGTYAVVGHKAVIVEQDECSFPRTFTGYVGRRTYTRTAPPTGTARTINLSLLDINVRLGFYVIRGRAWNRPRETIAARMTALLASTFLAPLVADNGFVDYPTHELDKNDYRGQFPLDVIRDCALAVGYNYFVYWDDPDGASLWFRDSNASTAFTSSLRISNVLSDVDDATTFASGKDAQLERDPSQVFSGVQVPFAKGSVFRARAATSAAYQPRHAVAPNSQVKKRSKAIALADHFLFERRNEEDVITDEIELPKEKVNLVRAGQRIQARYTDFTTEGYGEFSWFRILETRKRPIAKETIYKCGLTLSPQEGGCSVQPSYVGGNYADSNNETGQATFNLKTDASATSPGNLIVATVNNPISTNPGNVISVDGSWHWAVVNQKIVTADTDRANVFWKKSEGESTITIHWNAVPLGTTVRFCSAEYAGLTNPTLSGSVTTLRSDSPVENGPCPATPYPAGPSAVVFVCFMTGGPQSGDSLSTSGGISTAAPNLRTAIDSADHGSRETAIADWLLNGSSGTTPSTYPTDYLGFQFTDHGVMVNGLTFAGDNCT